MCCIIINNLAVYIPVVNKNALFDSERLATNKIQNTTLYTNSQSVYYSHMILSHNCQYYVQKQFRHVCVHDE